MYTRFMDMHSGGGTKEAPYDKIFIEAPEEEAKVIFYNRFGHSPDRVTCTCCGEDYSITEGESLAELSAYDRNCAYVYFYKDDGTKAEGTGKYGKNTVWDSDRRTRVFKGRDVEEGYVERPDLGHMEYGASRKSCEDRYMSLTDYFKLDSVLVVYAEDITDAERQGTVPASGYVWVD
jgi:hypothetical protein